MKLVRNVYKATGTDALVAFTSNPFCTPCSSIHNDQLVQARSPVFSPARFHDDIRQNRDLTLPVRVPAQHRQLAFGILWHNFQDKIADRTASEMGQKLIVRNVSFIPT